MKRLPRTSVWATALAIGAFQVIGTLGANQDPGGRKRVDAVAIVLALLGPASLALRERWPEAAAAVPVVAAFVYLYLGYLYGPIFLSVVVGLFLAVQAGRRRAAGIVAMAGFAGFAFAGRYGRNTEDQPGLVHMTLVAGWLALVLAVGEVARIRRLRAEEVARLEQDEQQRRVAEQRLDLARELHDVLAHNISMINVQAGVALHLIDERPEQVRPALTSIKEASREALHELRTALDVLRRGEEAPRSPAPRLADLPALVDGVRAGGLSISLDCADPPGPLSAQVELAAYRIVQEALTNVTRHARAGTVTVDVTFDDEVRIEVADDGVGSTAAAGNGINGMRERAAALGGSVEAGPRREGGFRVVARLPGGPA